MIKATQGAYTLQELRTMDNHDFELLYTCIIAEMKAQDRQMAEAHSKNSSTGIRMETVQYANGKGFNFGD